MPNQPQTTNTQPPAGGWRLTLGKWMFIVPFVMFFGAPVVIPMLGLDAGQSAALIGGVAVAAELIWFASIPLLGKAGFMEMKTKAFGLIKLKSGPVSASRQRLGSRLLLCGISGQILLHLVMIIGYAIIGAHPERVLLGLNFDQQLAVYFSLLIVAVFCTVAGVYALGADKLQQIRDAIHAA